MKLVHWPLMGGHLLQRGGDGRGLRDTLTYVTVHQSTASVPMVRCSAVLTCPKGYPRIPCLPPACNTMISFTSQTVKDEV